jgi:hypothetical protein
MYWSTLRTLPFAVGQVALGHCPERAGREPSGLGQEVHDRLDAVLDPAEAVVVAVVPGRVQMEAGREAGEIPRGEGGEAVLHVLHVGHRSGLGGHVPSLLVPASARPR